MSLPLNFAYFGGEPLGVPVLETLKATGFVPNLIVASPDRPAGRKHELTPPPVKIWAEANNIPVFQPESLKERDALTPLTKETFDLFVVVAYNKILPKWLLELPVHKTINLHPSLLPLYRGASPIRSAILEDNREAVGVSIMLMDKEMDHGPIITQEAHNITEGEWPMDGITLDAVLAERGGKLLVKTIASYINGKLSPQEQDHKQATYCGKINRGDGELKIDPFNLPTDGIAYATLLKIRAYAGWPGTFFIHQGKRIKVIEATLKKNGELQLLTVLPEGKKVQSFSHYLAHLTKVK